MSIKNPYSSPATFGLEIVDEFDCADSWEFDMLVLFRRLSDGQILMATDSGCSCPSPFEDLTLDTLEPATRDAIKEWFKTRRDDTCGPHPKPGEEAEALAHLEPVP